VTTGQAAGFVTDSTSAALITSMVGGTVTSTEPTLAGGWCLIDNLPAGTYSISVMFKAASGDTITVSGRRLRAMAIPFA